MDLNSEEVRYWADYAIAMGNDDYRERFTQLFVELQEQENKLAQTTGLQNTHVNPLE